MTFKLGQHVKCIEKHEPKGLFLNRFYTITGLDVDDTRLAFVRVNNSLYWFSVNRFVAAAMTPQEELDLLPVGDYK